MSILTDIQAGKASAPQITALLVAASGGRVTAQINAIAAACASHFPAFGMTTGPRVAEFIAQCANETGGFKVFEENLNYSAGALVATWPLRFTRATAPAFARKPQAIANKVYGGRMGNVAPGDGWTYRGRGMLQLTGRDNYAAFGKAIGVDLIAHPEKAADPAVSTRLALEFFRRGNVNAAVDAGDFAKARRITNGGAIGLEHVAALRARVLAALK